MTGSLAVKRGKYYAVINIYENGKRKQKWVSSDLPEKGNKRRAEQFLRDTLAEYERKQVLSEATPCFRIMFGSGWKRSPGRWIQ